MSVSDVAQSRKDTARVGVGDGAWPVADAVQTSRADMPARKSVLVPIAAPLCARITRAAPPCAQMRARARAASARTARERRTALHARRTNRTPSKPTVCGQTNTRCERARYAEYGVDLTPPVKSLPAAHHQIHRIRGSFENPLGFRNMLSLFVSVRGLAMRIPALFARSARTGCDVQRAHVRRMPTLPRSHGQHKPFASSSGLMLDGSPSRLVRTANADPLASTSSLFWTDTVLKNHLFTE